MGMVIMGWHRKSTIILPRAIQAKQRKCSTLVLFYACFLTGWLLALSNSHSWWKVTNDEDTWAANCMYPLSSLPIQGLQLKQRGWRWATIIHHYNETSFFIMYYRGGDVRYTAPLNAAYVGFVVCSQLQVTYSRWERCYGLKHVCRDLMLWCWDKYTLVFNA